MAQSSDEIIKREIVDKLGSRIGNLSLKIFPQSSNDDKKIFPEGLTFGIKNVAYGSCDACWVIENEKWINPFNNKVSNEKPIIALEGTDALNRGSSGNAQYQRFHHAFGAVKSGIIGIYYLKPGIHKIQEDLYGMAYFVSKAEKGSYLIINDLNELKELLTICQDEDKCKLFIKNKLESMYKIFNDKFEKKYKTWDKFAEKRSTILKDDCVIKYSGRSKRNFTDGSQRAGHIAVGEMYLTKYFFPKKYFYYLWAKMSSEDIKYLDEHKKDDKEWRILRSEPNVEIITLDDLEGLSRETKKELISIKDKPLKKEALKIYRKNLKIIREGLITGNITINKHSHIKQNSKKSL